MAEFDKSKHPMKGIPGKGNRFVEKGDGGNSANYDTMSASELSNELAQSIDNKQVTLPKQEYAALCSAIRTRFSSAIPPNGNILLGDAYYMFRYDSWSEKIVCIFKVDIDTYKEYISDVEGIFRND